MIEKELRELIEPNLKLHLLKEDWKYIDYMLEECYLLQEGDMPIVVIRPKIPNTITMKFYAINGGFAGTYIDWDRLENEGILL